MDTTKEAKKVAEKRLAALDNLECEVDTLQSQLSDALISQREANQMNQPPPLSDSTVDLVAAVKLTLLYVQNKLSPDDVRGHEAELERLKAELLNLRNQDAKRERSDEALSAVREENDILRSQSEANAARLALVKRSTSALYAELKDLVAAQAVMLRHELFEIRNLLQMYKKQMTVAVDQARMTMCAMTNFQCGFDSRLARKDAKICQLRASLTQSKEECAAKATESCALRCQLNVSNSALNELENLVKNIEDEREASRGLITQLVDFKESMNTIEPKDKDSMHPSLDGCPSCFDPVTRLSQQLEGELRRNNELEEELRQSKEKMRNMVAQAVEHSVDDAGSTKLASDVLSLNAKLEELARQNEMLQNELKLCQIGMWSFF